jgi:uroporphyrinogen-III synthase
VSAPVLLITRAEPGASALAGQMAAMGWAPLVWPLLAVEPVAVHPDTRGVQAVLLTSASAARSLPGAALNPLPPRTFCVGAATAAAAAKAGFQEIATGEGNAAQLAGHVAASLRPTAGRLLFLRGDVVAGSLSEALAAHGFTVDEAVVYRARAAETVPEAVAAVLDAQALTAAAFHSPRAAAIFAGLAGQWAGHLGAAAAVAISRKAAAPLQGMGFAAIHVAERPDAAGMQAALEAVRQGRGDAPVGAGRTPPLS